MPLQLKQKSTADKKLKEAKAAKFVAVGEPFRFRIVDGNKFEDIDGVLENGKLVFKIDQITEVDEFRYTVDVPVLKDGKAVTDKDGKAVTEKQERVIDAVARCREYCASGRLAEVSDDTELPIPTPDDTEGGDDAKTTKRGRR